MFDPGDLIFHPTHGFGTLSGLTRRDPLHPIQDVAASETAITTTQEYYDIVLMNGGTLLVPVNQAKRLGLRHLTNGVDAIIRCLQSPARSLPDDARKRASELWARAQMDEPMALAASVRDMLAQSRGRVPSASEKTWLTKSCESLISEAALVDHIPKSQASKAIWKEVKQLNIA